MKQRKIPFSRSLEGTDQQIKIKALIVEHKKTGLSIADIVKSQTGLTLYQYLTRPFNRLGYYSWKHQVAKWKYPKINFWNL
jgi:hypothetical protein